MIRGRQRPAPARDPGRPRRLTAPYAALWSGGKDSALAVVRARRAGRDVDLLLTFGDAASGRVRFHATTRAMVERQVRATVAGRGRAIFTSWEEMPAALDERLAELAGAGYAGVVLGDVHLADVRAWYEERVVAAGLEHVEPLWGEDPRALVAEFVAGGGRAVVTCVDTERLDPAWLGRVIDEAFVEEIAATGADPCGENGEYHSFAFAGPAFQEPVGWSPGERRSDGRFVQLDLLPT
ncbi:MAG: hypothetical protein E6J41_02415 [Chloroflexi bacterium]|nr:MAG: hypothetical protein E6J41_02415 [Chloroflexota bacterium]